MCIINNGKKWASIDDIDMNEILILIVSRTPIIWNASQWKLSQHPRRHF